MNFELIKYNGFDLCYLIDCNDFIYPINYYIENAKIYIEDERGHQVIYKVPSDENEILLREMFDIEKDEPISEIYNDYIKCFMNKIKGI
jgi:hypothetical protein